MCAHQPAGRGALLVYQRQEQVLGRDVGIAERLGLVLGAIEDAGELPAQASVRRSPRPGWETWQFRARSPPAEL